MPRALGRFETALTLSGERDPFVVVVVLRLAAGPPAARLGPALEALQRRHPVLGVRIVAGPGGYRFEPEGTPEVPLRVLPRRGDEAWKAVAEGELGRPVDAGRGPLLRCVYLAPDDAGDGAAAEVVLAFHHAAMDAASGAALVAELLCLCEPGAVLPPAAPGFPPAAEDRRPARHRGLPGFARRVLFLVRQGADELAWRLRSPGGPAAPAPGRPARCRLLVAGLSRPDTAALVRRSRRRRVTLHAALHAALLLAVHRHLGDGYHGWLRAITFADLRPRLEPPVPAGVAGSYLSMLRFTVPVGPPAPDGSLWPLAARVDRRVEAALRRGDRFTAAHFAPAIMRRFLAGGTGRMATTALSYGGPLRLPGGIPYPVRGLHVFVSNLPVGPRFTAQARIFDGRLDLDVVTLEGDLPPGAAAAVTREALDLLRDAGGEEGR
jgi:hypothetical protein